MALPGGSTRRSFAKQELTTTMEPKVITTPAFSEEEIANLIAEVERQGGERNRQLGKDAHEPDFVAGAGVVLHALGLWNKVPPKWLIGGISNRPIFEHAHERPFIDFDEVKAVVLAALDHYAKLNVPGDEFDDHHEGIAEARKAVNEVFPS